MKSFLLISILLLVVVVNYNQAFQQFKSKKIAQTIFMIDKYADPKNDIVFKKLFGDKDILANFINNVLPSKHVKNVEYVPTNIEPEIRSKKQSIIDVLCTDENGSKYIVEMQSAKEKGFEKRAVYYASKTYGTQMNKGGKYSDLLEVIFIAITDFVLFPEKNNYFSTHTIRDTLTNEHDLTSFTFTFIELPKYKSHDNPEGIEEWVDLFKTASKRKTIDTSDPIIKRAYERLEISNWSDQDLLDYQAYEKILLDNQAILDQVFDEGEAKGIAKGIAKSRAEGEVKGEAKGIAKGIAEGEVKGEAKGIAKAVKSMLRAGFDENKISNILGLSLDEISRMRG